MSFKKALITIVLAILCSCSSNSEINTPNDPITTIFDDEEEYDAFQLLAESYTGPENVQACSASILKQFDTVLNKVDVSLRHTCNDFVPLEHRQSCEIGSFFPKEQVARKKQEIKIKLEFVCNQKFSP